MCDEYAHHIRIHFCPLFFFSEIGCNLLNIIGELHGVIPLLGISSVFNPRKDILRYLCVFAKILKQNLPRLLPLSSQWNAYPSTTLSLDTIESKTGKKIEYNPYISDTLVTTLIIQIKFYIKENVALQTLQHSVLKQMACHPKLYLQYVFHNSVILKE